MYPADIEWDIDANLPVYTRDYLRLNPRRQILWHTPHKAQGGRYDDPVWPIEWPIPAVGSIVYIDDDPLWVKAIDFHPMGEDGDPTPFIYVVLAITPR